MTGFTKDQAVRHRQLGDGRVVADLGDLVLVRFGAAIEQVLTDDLEAARSLETALASGTLEDGLKVMARAQALAIKSINDQWGLFSRSRVQLLPHQLWVCREVTSHWPARWLVADDVGLGKTIEAGLILSPLMASGRVRRVLVLAPARLVPQWRERMKQMFDIRLNEYVSAQDRGSVTFWETNDAAVASFQTLRMDKARERLLMADPWDLVIVDEAHHFQAQERRTTLTFGLLQTLEEAKRIQSLVLFTGTPHRGKDYGFLALMGLVRPDLFSPERDMASQLPDLHKAMIRNNKATVTDLKGNKLFQPVTVTPVDYGYSAEERAFYDTMSAFILDGRAYANSLTGRGQTARMLLLIALQKLAASSISAIRSALVKRRHTISSLTKAIVIEEPEVETLDEQAEAEEHRAASSAINLLQNEIDRLNEIITLAEAVPQETKTKRLITLVEGLPPGETVLFFTEYKATQAMVLAALEDRFGRGSVAFINGEDRLNLADGRTLSMPRARAAEDFNAGRVRFLISTEAGGEGIDLQRRCATLVHVDLPWNPMRMHQRVGRLNRYGQTRPVQVYLLRNDETVEARIWDLLQAKLLNIQAALSASMEEAEDIAQLVIGMQGGSFFDDLFTSAPLRPKGGGLKDWFDAKTVEFGGRDVVETVRGMVGNVAHYDFQSLSRQIPDLDLPDLEPFLRNALSCEGRRLLAKEEGFSVVTPDNWRDALEIRDRFDGLKLDRNLPVSESASKLLGVGHALVDKALISALSRPLHLARIIGLQNPLVLFQVIDEVTGRQARVHEVLLAFGGNEGGILNDGETLRILNVLKPQEGLSPHATPEELASIERILHEAPPILTSGNLAFQRPKAHPMLCLLPGS
jgi:ERCC4-related helicase